MRSFVPLAPLALALVALPSPGLAAPINTPQPSPCALSASDCSSAILTPTTAGMDTLFRLPSVGTRELFSPFDGAPEFPSFSSNADTPGSREPGVDAREQQLQARRLRRPSIPKPPKPIAVGNSARPGSETTGPTPSSSTASGNSPIGQIIDGVSAVGDVLNGGADVAQVVQNAHGNTDGTTDPGTTDPCTSIDDPAALAAAGCISSTSPVTGTSAVIATSTPVPPSSVSITPIPPPSTIIPGRPEQSGFYDGAFGARLIYDSATDIHTVFDGMGVSGSEFVAQCGAYFRVGVTGFPSR